MLQIIPRLQDTRMHLLHHIPQLDSKPTQDIPLPSIVLGIHPALHLLVINHTDTKALPSLRRVECQTSLFDLGEKLLPVGERVAEAVEDVFGFEVSEGLELEPFGNVGLEGLDFELD
jgi:hypothetical protein